MNTQNNFNLSIKTIGLITAAILMIPFIAMQFSEQVNWGIFDFMLMGALIFGLGLALKWIMLRTKDVVHHIAVGIALGTTFLLIWTNLAVGLIGSGPNLVNLLYIAVIGIVVFGPFISQFSVKGMERTMHGAAFAILLIASIALITGMQNQPNSSVIKILFVNGVFAGLFIVSALLFRSVQKRSSY